MFDLIKSQKKILFGVIKRLYGSYFNDESYVYKSCQNYIVVLKKLPQTKTNESRQVDNNKNASYRGNKFQVVLIFNKFNPDEKTNEITNDIYPFETIKYIVGQTVQSKYFDVHLQNTCSSGIHYYKNWKCAYYCNVSKYLKTTKVKNWFEDGFIEYKYFLIDGKLNGFFQQWFEDGSRKKNVIIRMTC